MPRGRKPAAQSLQEKLANISAEINQLVQRIEELKLEKKEVEKQIEAQEMQAIYSIVKKHGLSAEDAINKIQSII